MLRDQTHQPHFLLLFTSAWMLRAASAAADGGLLDLNSPERRACVDKRSYEALARLPQGLAVVNELEWAPYMLAWTPQAVLAAPYHRLSSAILAQHRAFALPPEGARGILAGLGAAYVVTCGSHGAAGLEEKERAASLWGQLRAGAIPDWLEPAPESQGQPITIYRVKL